MPGRRWTDEDRRALVELAGAGVRAASIAAKLGRSESAVWQQLSVLRDRGLVPTRKRRWSDHEDARLLAALRAGLARAQIAAELGRSPSAVATRAAKAGVREAGAPRRPTWAAEQDRRLLDLYREGSTLLEIAGDLDRPAAAVASRVDVLRGRGVSLAPRKPRWTEERRTALARRRFIERATLRQLEHEFGRTRGTITSQLRRLRALGYDPG